MNYRADIDGLRAIAVVLVVLFHAKLLFTGGFVGVDVFFVISGFLITRSITGAIEKNEYSILKFYDHRVRRILPALIAVLTVSSIGMLFLRLPNCMDQVSGYGCKIRCLWRAILFRERWPKRFISAINGR